MMDSYMLLAAGRPCGASSSSFSWLACFLYISLTSLTIWTPGAHPSSANLLQNRSLVVSVGRKKLQDALGHRPSLVAFPATEADCGSPRARGQAVHLLELAAQMALVGEATLVRHRCD